MTKAQKKKEKEEVFISKRNYVPPHVEVMWIEHEEGIAAMSAMVKPGNGSDDVKEEWENGQDVSGDMEW